MNHLLCTLCTTSFQTDLNTVFAKSDILFESPLCCVHPCEVEFVARTTLIQTMSNDVISHNRGGLPIEKQHECLQVFTLSTNDISSRNLLTEDPAVE